MALAAGFHRAKPDPGLRVTTDGLGADVSAGGGDPPKQKIRADSERFRIGAEV